MTQSTVKMITLFFGSTWTRRCAVLVAAFAVISGLSGCGGNDKDLVKVDMPATGNEFSTFFAGTWESEITEKETTSGAGKKQAQDRYVFRSEPSQYSHGKYKSYSRNFEQGNWAEGLAGSWHVDSVDPDQNQVRLTMISMKPGWERYAFRSEYDQHIEKKYTWVMTLTSASKFGLEAGDLSRGASTDLYRGFAQQGFLATPTYTKILDGKQPDRPDHLAGISNESTSGEPFDQDSAMKPGFGDISDVDSEDTPPDFVPRDDDRFKTADFNRSTTDSQSGSIDEPEPTGFDITEKLDPTERLIGSYLGTYRDKVTIKLILLEEGRVEYYQDGEKMEMISNPVDGRFFVREMRWLVKDDALEMRVLGGLTYYEIKDDGNIVGPITKLKDRRRYVVPVADRVTFKKTVKPTGLAGSGLLSKKDDPVSSESEIPLDAEIGFDIGDIAPPIVGTDVNGVRFRLSDYRGKVVLLDFWGDWSAPCRAQYPHRRSLVENMKDKPFLILGVNSDPKFKVQETMKRENLTWRSFWDGGTTRGPIARQYDISGWPTTYLIDHLGVIRHKQLQGVEILEAVEGLVAKIAAAPPKQSSLRGFVDNTGQFTIVARFVEFKNGQAYLEKSDGTVVTLSMNKLSKEDQRYIREVLKTRKAAAEKVVPAASSRGQVDRRGFEVRGAGKSSVVGAYAHTGERNGRPKYSATSGAAKANAAFIYWESRAKEPFWAMTGNDESSGRWAYINLANTPDVPVNGWQVLNGVSPAPKLVLKEGAATGSK